MRALAALFCLAASLSALSALAQTPPAPGVKLVQPCETLGQPGCPVHLSIEGPITVETRVQFVSLLEAEQKRSGASVKLVVTIRSTGGDVNVAMAIGRAIRARSGQVSSTGPCYSACTFLAMGGVERNLAGIGLHRPAFAKFEADGLADADAHYKRMIRNITHYMAEMNISDAILQMILTTPPSEIRYLSQPDARRLGFNGVDPAFEELRTSQQAAGYGLTSMEWRNRILSLDKPCGREADIRSPADAQKRDECRSRLRESALWGFDEETFGRFNRALTQRCQALAPDSPELRACMRTIADEFRRDARAANLSSRPPAP